MRIWGTLDAFLEPGPPLGRRVANRSFLRALIRHGPLDRHDFFLADDRAAAACAADLQAEFPTAWADGALVVRTVDELARGLAAESYHCFHLANCVLFQPHLAALRNRVAPTLFPITGVTHSLSYARDLPRWLAHLSADTTARDAIVATSSTGAAALRAIFATLAARYVIVGAVTPRIAQLPLGLELGDFPAITSAQRTAQRVDLGFAPDDVVVLGFGRIAHASKMDLLPLFAACARLPAAARATLVVVIAGGLDAGDRTPELLEAMAAAGEVRLRVATNPTDAARIALYGSADVFVSPIDNPQETFGLTVIEAAAMGLPVIASDYDGYRDLVVDGETGFLIPTLGPATTDDTDALANLLFDDQYASRVSRLANWEEVCLPEEVLDSISEFIGRAAHRKTVFESWGFDPATARGMTALFAGPPGTGKTLVAGLVARELGLELYRIDLARIVSKWIGETEKNLAEVFDAAEDGQCVIVFDEADSLFARRTEVKSSVDRYANLEVNYLLQRLDTFEGIAILTTNIEGSIDDAFKRRMSMRLTFPFPDEETRLRLWAAHIPAQAPVQGDLKLLDIATRFPLSGGYIRNCALRAAFLAAQKGSPLTHEHLLRAINLEYLDIGKLQPGGRLT